MKNFLKKQKVKLHLFFFISIILFFSLTVRLYSADRYNLWGISKKEILKEYIPKNSGNTEFSPDEKPDYDNKIMNMVNLIIKNVDDDVFEKMVVLRTGLDPRKDFLLYNNKLFSVMEYYDSISKEKLSGIIKDLSKKYGEPNNNPGNDMDIYFISTENTKIIVHYYTISKKCEIYYYDSKLYHKLSSNEF